MICDAVMVAKVDKQQVAVIALAMDPSRQANCLTNVRGAELATIMGAIGVHDGVGSLTENVVEKPRPRFTGRNIFVNPRGRG
jgi:hypothetical protein